MSEPESQLETQDKKKKGILRGCLIAIVAWIAFVSIFAVVVTRLDPTYTELEGAAAPLIKALQEYKIEHGNYPATVDALTPKYVTSIPVCPGKKVSIPYFKEKELDEYELICYGFFTHKLRYRSRTGEWDSFD